VRAKYLFYKGIPYTYPSKIVDTASCVIWSVAYRGWDDIQGSYMSGGQISKRRGDSCESLSELLATTVPWGTLLRTSHVHRGNLRWSVLQAV